MEQLDDAAEPERLSTVDTQSSRLIRLPTEILLAIANFFEWHDKFLFSHTCRLAKKVIDMDMKDWDNLFELKHSSRIMSKAARVFLAGLAWTMPHHWVCEFCVKLHHISQACPTFGSQAMKSTDVPSKLDTLLQPAALTIHHSRIQMVLKLTRMKNNGVAVDCQLLSKVLQSHTVASRCEWKDEPHRCNRVQGVIAPKVIRGTFILYARVETTRCAPRLDRTGLWPGDVDGYTSCKHMTYTLRGLVLLSWGRSSNSSSSPLGFHYNLITAFEERGTPVKGYCKYCLLDCTLVATADSFIVESWQSLGRYDRPQDALTDEPLDLKDLPLEDRHWMLSPGRIITPRIGVALMGGELVYHQPGSVRDAYMSG